MKAGLCSLIEQYSNLILAIEDNEDFDPHWLCFYRIQMAFWIMSRMGRCSDLEHAHMVYNRIRLSWEDVSRYIRSGNTGISDIEGLFKSIDLGFTGQNGPKFPPDMASVS